MRLRTRFILSFSLITGIGFYQLTDWLIDDLEIRYREAVEETLVDASNLLAGVLEEAPADPAFLRGAIDRTLRRRFEARIYELRKTRVDLRVYVTDARGVVVYDSRDGRDEGRDYSRWRDVRLTLSGAYGARSTRDRPDDPSTSVLYVASPIRREGRIAGAVTVAKPTSSISRFIAAARPKILYAGALAALVVGLVGVLLVLWVTLPLRRLANWARDARDGRAGRLPPLGRSEVRELGLAMEEMREALEGRKYVENYVHALTHELKSPLSSISGAAELLEEDPPEEHRHRFLSNIRAESRRMAALVERLLALAGLEGRRELEHRDELAVAGILRSTTEGMDALLHGRGLALHPGIAPELSVRGDRLLLVQALRNLIDNAVAFSPSAGTIEIRACRVAADRVAVEILDQGPGMPDWAVARAGERFFSLPRPESGRKGTGLGLAFVREVARLHGGILQLSNRPEGGLHARLELPAA